MSASTSHKSSFNQRSTAEQVTEGLELAGKVIVITGVNSGLGFESMRVLAKRGAHVIGLARTLKKAQEACNQINGETTPVACELSDLESVNRAAEAIKALNHPIDVVMCNAGIMALQNHEQRYELEMQFLTNHIGHFLLIRQLLGCIKAVKSGRIVITSSGGHINAPKGGIEFSNLSGNDGYNAWKAYGQSKLANVLCSNELSRRLKGDGITVNSAHPGVIQTNLARYAGGWMTRIIQWLAPLFERSIGQGAATQVYLAVHPDCADVSGVYFADCNEATPSKYAQDKKLAKRLWDVSENILVDYL